MSDLWNQDPSEWKDPLSDLVVPPDWKPDPERTKLNLARHAERIQKFKQPKPGACPVCSRVR
jgi:hypothetical protein